MLEMSKEDLIENLLIAYKNVQIMAMTADVYADKLKRIGAITEESTLLPSIDRPPANFPE